MAASNHNYLECTVERALFGESRLDGIVSTFHSNERPLQGLAGWLDWQFRGAISNHLKSGAIRGELGECAYLPMVRNGRTCHLLLVGAGSSSSPGIRQELDAKTLSVLRKNIRSLKIERLGVSRADFGDISNEAISQQFKEVPVWIVP